MAGRGEVRFKLVAEVEQVKNALNEVKNQVSALGNDLAGRLGPAGSILQAMGPQGMAAAAGIGAAAAAVATLGSWAKDLIDAGGALADLSAKASLSTDALQEYAYAGSMVGISMEQIGGSVTKLSERLASGGTEIQKTLGAMGMSLAEINALRPEEQFRAIASGIRDIATPGEQAAAAMALFGKSGLELLPLIRSDFEATAAKAHELGLIMSGETVSAADRLGDQIDTASQQFTKMKEAIAAVIINQPEVQSAFSSLISLLAKLIPLAAQAADKMIALGKAVLLPTTVISKITGEQGANAARAAAFSASASQNATVGDAKSLALAEAKKLEEALATAIDKSSESSKKAAKAISAHESELSKLNGTIRHTYDELVNMGPLEDYFDLPANNVLRSPNLTAGMKELVPFRVDGGIEIDLEREGKKAGEAVRSGFGSALDSLPGVIVGALQGGGNVFQSVGATLLGGLFSKDSELVKKLSSGLSSLLGKGIGSALGSIIPGLGTALGGLAGGLLDGLLKNFNEKKGKILGAIVGGPLGFVFGGMLGKQAEHKRVNDMRDQFFEAHGGWQALQKQLSTLSNQDLVKKIFDAKTVEQFNRAVKEAEGLLGLQSEAQQKLQEAIDKYGFSIDELGPKFQQQKLDEMAGGLLQDYKLLTASGIEQNTVLAKMGPAFQDYVNTALKAGAALPEAMRPIIEQLIASGQLLDENGNAFTSLEQSGISFTQTLSEGLQSLISKIDELVRALTGAGSAAGRISIPNGGSLGNGKGLEEQPRSFAGGSGGFQNFGSGTPAVLHGVEAVIRPGDLRSMGGPNVTYAPVITVYGAGNADEIRDVVMTSLRDNAAGMRDYVATVRG